MPVSGLDLTDPSNSWLAALAQKPNVDPNVNSSSLLDMSSSNPNGGPGSLSLPALTPMASIGQNPMLPKIDLSKPNAHASQTDTGKQTAIHNSKLAQWMSPEQYSALRSQYLDTPEMQSQKEGVDQLQNMFDMNKNLQANSSHMDLSPIMAFVDAQTGSNLAKDYNAPANNLQLANALSGQASNVQDKRQQLSKDILDAVQKMKSGSVQDEYMKALTNASTAGVGSNSGGSGLGNARMNALTAKSGSDFDHDKIITQLTQTNNSLDRALSMAYGKAPVTAKNLNILQQDMINAMAPGGAATEGKVNRELVTPVASMINDLQQRFGNVQDLRKDPNAAPIFNQLVQLMKQVKQDYNRAGIQQTDQIAKNWENIDYDPIQKTVQGKVAFLHNKFGGGEAPAAPAASGRPGALSKPPSQWTPEDQKSVDDYEKVLAGKKGP